VASPGLAAEAQGVRQTQNPSPRFAAADWSRKGNHFAERIKNPLALI
jgi:hypothetical protein